MDHFFLLDAKQALEEEEEAEMLKRFLSAQVDITTFSSDELEILERLATKDASTLLDSHHNEVHVLGAEEYLSDLKQMFASIPSKPKPKKWKKGKKGEKQRKKWERKVREFEENYQIVHVAPSIIPAYYSGIRVFEYNISELVGKQFTRSVDNVETVNWTKWWAQMDMEVGSEMEDHHESYPGRLQLQDSDWADDQFDHRMTKFHSQNPSTQMKPKKRPPAHIPAGPHKSAPRGPLFEPQLFTPLRWEVHFANLTEINAKYKENPTQDWNYQNFFKLEYASDSAPYNMKDLTLNSWLELARKIGKEKKTTEVDTTNSVMETNSDIDDYIEKGSDRKGKEKKGKGKKGKKEKKKAQTYWDVFLRRAFVNSGHHLGLDVV